MLCWVSGVATGASPVFVQRLVVRALTMLRYSEDGGCSPSGIVFWLSGRVRRDARPRESVAIWAGRGPAGPGTRATFGIQPQSVVAGILMVQ